MSMAQPAQPADGTSSAERALWGEQSLTERFGGLSGRELQEKVFAIYQAGHNRDNRA